MVIIGYPIITEKKRRKQHVNQTEKNSDIGEEVQNIKAAYAKASKPPATKTLKISYNKIYKALDKTATKTTIASLILTFVTAALPFPVLTTVALLINSFSYVLSMVVQKMKSSGKTSKSHGVKVGLKRATYKKHQAGKVFYYYKYKITSLATY